MAEPSLRSVVASSVGWSALAVVLIVACTGACSPGEDDPAPDPPGPTALASCDGPPPGENVEITLAHAEGVGRDEWIDGYVERFEAANPGISVDVRASRQGNPKLLADWRDATPDDRPSVTLLPQAASALLVDSGQTVAPGDCIDRVAPDMLPSIRAAWSTGGVLRAVPFAVSTPVLYYNRQLFTAAGLDPDRPPTTLGDLRLAATKMVDADVAAHGLAFDTGPESGGAWMVEQFSAEAGELSLTPDNGRQRPAASVAWRTGPAVDYVEWLDGMHDDGLALSVGRNQSGIEDIQKAADPAAPIAMAFHTCGSLGQVIDFLESGDTPHVDLDVAPLPSPGSGLEPGQGSLPGGSALWLAAGKSEAETAAAWRLASFLAQPDIQAEWAAATGHVPLGPRSARLEPLASRWREHPEMRVAYDVLADHGTLPADLGPLAGPLGEIHELLADALHQVVEEDADPAVALREAAVDADRLLAAYNGSRPSPRLRPGSGPAPGPGDLVPADLTAAGLSRPRPAPSRR